MPICRREICGKCFVNTKLWRIIFPVFDESKEDVENAGSWIAYNTEFRMHKLIIYWTFTGNVV